MAMMMTGRVLLVFALCVLWCGAGGADGSAGEYFVSESRAQLLRRKCAEEFSRRAEGGANASAVEECVRHGMDGVRAVVDGRSRWRRQHSAVAAAAPAEGSGEDEDHREENDDDDDKLKGLSFSGQTLPEEKKDPTEGREGSANVPGGANKLKADKGEPNPEKEKVATVVHSANPNGSQEVVDMSLTVVGDRQDPKHAENGRFNTDLGLMGNITKYNQTEGEGDRRNQLPAPPEGTEGTEVGLLRPLELTEKQIPIPVEENVNPRDGSHAHKTGMLQKRDSPEHEEGETISSGPQRGATKVIPEVTTPLSTANSGSGAASSTVERGGANNPQIPAAPVTKNDSKGDTGPAAPPASSSELRTQENSNAGTGEKRSDYGNGDSIPAVAPSAGPTTGTRSTQNSGDASYPDRANNDDVNDDVARKDNTAEFETATEGLDTTTDNNERHKTVPDNATNTTSNTEATTDSDSSTAVSHTTSPLLLLLFCVCGCCCCGGRVRVREREPCTAGTHTRPSLSLCVCVPLHGLLPSPHPTMHTHNVPIVYMHAHPCRLVGALFCTTRTAAVLPGCVGGAP
ncbi:mucin-associated surface protein (MASP), putative [Trypanosoma cruzi marinkellei]|uniref:Mucin-associated surface protein (MASP), putative n=1 Tax=Trypanosoma cruzi marinkellei TaxID=85056 RepID=K2MRF1_TRYCR|nr:mucin-associated surface protein (MASP), putative [Trypanosoma cruzi marinkellei]